MTMTRTYETADKRDPIERAVIKSIRVRLDLDTDELRILTRLAEALEELSDRVAALEAQRETER